MRFSLLDMEAEYLRFREECVEIAQRAPNASQRIMLLHIAETWLRLAESVKGEHHPSRWLH